MCNYIASPLRPREAALALQEVSSPQGGNRALGMSETLRTIIHEEGPRGLYRGLLANFLKVIPAVSIGYVVYEKVKSLLNVETVR